MTQIDSRAALNNEEVPNHDDERLEPGDPADSGA